MRAFVVLDKYDLFVVFVFFTSFIFLQVNF